MSKHSSGFFSKTQYPGKSFSSLIKSIPNRLYFDKVHPIPVFYASPCSNFLLHCITELIIDLVSSEQIDSAPAKLKAVVRKTDTIQVIN